MKSTLDQQIALQSAAKKSALFDKAKEREQMDALVQQRIDEDKRIEEQKRLQQDYYRGALDQQKPPSSKDRMDAGADPYGRLSPSIGGYKGAVAGYHGSVLKEAALSALQSK